MIDQDGEGGGVGARSLYIEALNFQYYHRSSSLDWSGF